jgi:hypothetical protein
LTSLAAFWLVIWRYGFSDQDRVLFRKAGAKSVVEA